MKNETKMLLEKYGIVEKRKVKMLCCGCNGRIIWVKLRDFVRAYESLKMLWCERCGQMLCMAIKERTDGDKA